MSKKILSFFLSVLMVLSFCLPHMTASAQTEDLGYEITKTRNEDENSVTISIDIAEKEGLALEKVTLPDGAEQTEELNHITYSVTENGDQKFVISYTIDGEEKEEELTVQVTEIKASDTGTDGTGTTGGSGDDADGVSSGAGVNKAARTGNETTAATWADVEDAVAAGDAGTPIVIKVTDNLKADSQIEIDGQEVVIYTDVPGITITRTAAPGDDSTPALFYLKNSAQLTIGAQGERITYLDPTSRRQNSELFWVMSGSKLTLENALIRDLKIGWRENHTAGGAIYTSGSTVSLKDVDIENCTGADGTFIYIENSKVEMDGCDMTGNKVYGNANQGGVVYTKGSSTELTMRNCTVTGNTSAEPDEIANVTGPLHFIGGKVTITDTVIAENHGQYGVGINASDTDLTLDGVTIQKNVCVGHWSQPTDWQGAGLSLVNGTVDMSNTKITENSGAFIGGGICVTGTAVTLDDTVTVSGNSAACGGGVFVQGKGTVVVDGASITGNTAQASATYADASLVAYNGCGGGITNNGSTVELKSGTISGNTASEMGGGIHNLGTLSVTGGTIEKNEAKAETLGYVGDAILQMGTFSLSNAPKIEGDVFLESGCVIDVPAAYTGAPILVDVIKNDNTGNYADLYDETYQEGRNVVVYADSLEVPGEKEKQLFTLADSIQADGYALRNEEKVTAGGTPNTRILELYIAPLTVTAKDLTVYEGGYGSNQSTDTGDALPEPTWTTDFTGKTVTVGGQSWDIETKGLPFVWKYLAEDDGAAEEVTDSARAGEYYLYVYPMDGYKDKEILIDGVPLVLSEDGTKAATIKVREITDNDGADALSSDYFKSVYNYESPLGASGSKTMLSRASMIDGVFNANGTHDGTCDQTQAHAHVKTGTTFLKNGDENFPVNANAKIGLLWDDLLSDTLGQDNITEMLHTKSLETAKGVFDTSYDVEREFKYLDLVDMNDGNIWVGTDGSDITVYYPYPEGADQNDTIAVTYFDGLTRDYTVNMNSMDLENEVAKSGAHLLNVTKTEEGILFDVPSKQFGPFELMWQKPSSDKTEENEGGDTPGENTDRTDADVTNTGGKNVNRQSRSEAAPVQTGDDSDITVWLSLLVISAGCLSILAIIRKRANRNG